MMEETVRLPVSKYTEIFARLQELEDVTRDNVEKIKQLENQILENQIVKDVE